MYLTTKQEVKQLSNEDKTNLRELCHIAKNLYNQGLYNVRQYYFEESEYLNYEKNYTLLKSSENYKLLNSNMAQQILKEVDGVFKSFFGLIKLAKKGKYNFRDIKLPQYLKKDGYYTLVIGFVRINHDTLIIPYSRSFNKTHSKIEIKIPKNLLDKKIKEIRIIPKDNAKRFEIQYIYEVRENEQGYLNSKNALSIDLGVNNFATCVTSNGKTFILDGRRMKSYNQWYNKYNSILQSKKDKQGLNFQTKKQRNITRKRNNRINDIISKYAKYIINYCVDNDIGNLVVGYNETFQRNVGMGKVNNQNFVNIPFGKFREKLEYLCKLYGINFVKQEESYTSKASFFDNDEIPTYNADNPKKYVFSGRREKRGLYRLKNGKALNADVNGALNILRKSKVVDLTVLCHSGELNTPIRINCLINKTVMNV